MIEQFIVGVLLLAVGYRIGRLVERVVLYRKIGQVVLETDEESEKEEK